MSSGWVLRNACANISRILSLLIGWGRTYFIGSFMGLDVRTLRMAAKADGPAISVHSKFVMRMVGSHHRPGILG